MDPNRRLCDCITYGELSLASAGGEKVNLRDKKRPSFSISSQICSLSWNKGVLSPVPKERSTSMQRSVDKNLTALEKYYHHVATKNGAEVVQVVAAFNKIDFVNMHSAGDPLTVNVFKSMRATFRQINSILPTIDFVINSPYAKPVQIA